MRRTRIAPLAAAGAPPAASASTGTALAAGRGDVVVSRTERAPLTAYPGHRAQPAPGSGAGAA
ncbi:hypothetical protein [Streptomyces malaysiense]|uniref:Uncharacterized protein n=1 Tax=Streptomyces malaysiense TaxID=1428626 RepID=A0A1J4Q0V8_9ACTN|nr:hypothetical protein [Streptomyces malaysiense]OIK26038.1 hypothetical protein VT52_018680 [Streptomyces malaysiense]